MVERSPSKAHRAPAPPSCSNSPALRLEKTRMREYGGPRRRPSATRKPDCPGEIMKKLYALYVSLVSKLQSPFLLIIRLYWGWHFFLTGKGKLMNLDRTAGFFATLHIP